MGQLFGWLDKSYTETIKAYDNRMNRLPELHAGYVFFDWVNYNTYTQSFSVYIEWNGELNHKLQDRMPQGGYCFLCKPEEAACFTSSRNGSPVYIKLHAKCGRLYIKRLYFNSSDKQYPLYFNGCDVIPPKMVCFMDREPFDGMTEAVSEKSELKADGSAAAGSSRKKRAYFYGSYRSLYGSGIGGSYRSLYGSGISAGGSYRSLNGSFYNMPVVYEEDGGSLNIGALGYGLDLI